MKRDDVFAVFAAITLAFMLTVAGMALGLFAALMLPNEAKAHSWYDNACCSDEDCHRIQPEELTFTSDKWIWTSAKLGAVHIIHTGSRSPVDGQFRIRVSKDGQYHGCERNLASGEGQPAQWVAYCLYFPELY